MMSSLKHFVFARSKRRETALDSGVVTGQRRHGQRRRRKPTYSATYNRAKVRREKKRNYIFIENSYRGEFFTIHLRNKFLHSYKPTPQFKCPAEQSPAPSGRPEARIGVAGAGRSATPAPRAGPRTADDIPHSPGDTRRMFKEFKCHRSGPF
ncbi:hypothetical protein EVAR_12983_1 [Eumeta japonica]|uniref:Uncharacterized protein n=1 Tax=Eumeta variegata TaxID=151549 RepID=A0A4C1TWW9_EUMVA|nr:hypothetical protein EVAR_12983_1 [Eumeta japonica]